jgi:hypothetical protein
MDKNQYLFFFVFEHANTVRLLQLCALSLRYFALPDLVMHLSPSPPIAGLSFQEILVALKSNALLPEVRSVFTELMLQLYVDRAPQSITNRVHLVRLWREPSTPLRPHAIAATAITSSSGGSGDGGGSGGSGDAAANIAINQSSGYGGGGALPPIISPTASGNGSGSSVADQDGTTESDWEQTEVANNQMKELFNFVMSYLRIASYSAHEWQHGVGGHASASSIDHSRHRYVITRGKPTQEFYCYSRVLNDER